MQHAPMFLFTLIWLLLSCQKDVVETGPPFATVPAKVGIDVSISEASGLAVSASNPGYLWVHEDSGTPPRLTLLKKDGTVVKSMVVDGADNVDWEDMALSKGPDPSLSYLYLADVGDNFKVRNDYIIYRVPEPMTTASSAAGTDKIRFDYPDGSRDAEAIFVEHQTKSIYIITKSDNPARVYKLPFPQSTTTVNQAVFVGQLGFSSVTGAAMSPDGKEIIIKTYLALNYFNVSAGQTVENAFKKTPESLAYELEPQGEAVAFAADNSGFYTISEKAFSSVVNLCFYKRN